MAGLVLALGCKGNSGFTRDDRALNGLRSIRTRMCGCKFDDRKCVEEHEERFAAWKREFGDWKPRDAEATTQIEHYEACLARAKNVQATLDECAPIKMCAKLSHREVEAACSVKTSVVEEYEPNVAPIEAFVLGEACFYESSDDQGIAVERICFLGSEGAQKASNELARRKQREADEVLTSFGDESYYRGSPTLKRLTVRHGRVLYMAGIDQFGEADRQKCLSALISKMVELR